jgi:hypothetical protein
LAPRYSKVAEPSAPVRAVPAVLLVPTTAQRIGTFACAAPAELRVLTVNDAVSPVVSDARSGSRSNVRVNRHSASTEVASPGDRTRPSHWAAAPLSTSAGSITSRRCSCRGSESARLSTLLYWPSS